MRRILISFALPSFALLGLILWQFLWQDGLALEGGRWAYRLMDDVSGPAAGEGRGKQGFPHPADRYRARPDVVAPGVGRSVP